MPHFQESSAYCKPLTTFTAGGRSRGGESRQGLLHVAATHNRGNTSLEPADSPARVTRNACVQATWRVALSGANTHCRHWKWRQRIHEWPWELWKWADSVNTLARRAALKVESWFPLTEQCGIRWIEGKDPILTCNYRFALVKSKSACTTMRVDENMLLLVGHGVVLSLLEGGLSRGHRPGMCG